MKNFDMQTTDINDIKNYIDQRMDAAEAKSLERNNALKDSILDLKDTVIDFKSEMNTKIATLQSEVTNTKMTLILWTSGLAVALVLAGWLAKAFGITA